MITLQLSTPKTLTEAHKLILEDTETQKWAPYLLQPAEPTEPETNTISLAFLQDTTLTGWVTLIQKRYTASLEYTVFPAHRGKGLGYEMVSGLHSWIKSHTTIQHLYAAAHKNNYVSNRTLHKANYLLKDSRGKFNIYSHIYSPLFL